MPAVPKPARGSGRLDRKAKKASEEAALREAYEEVDRRDAGICRVTGRFTRSDAVMAEERREHHHLKGRRVRPDWVTDPRRIITVCKEAHDYLTGHYLEVEGNDATKPLFFFWNETMMRGRVRPFRIVSKRTSAA